TGSDWKTVSGTSPVPGGMSTNMKSTSDQMTSVQNCFTVPAMTGPRHTTGSPGSSSSRFMDIICTPDLLIAGSIPSAQPSARPSIPNILGTDGPVRSASSTAVRYPLFWSAEASSELTSD